MRNATSAPTAGNCSANMDAVALMTDANNSGQLYDIAQFRAVAILSVEVSNSLLVALPEIVFPERCKLGCALISGSTTGKFTGGYIWKL